MTSREPIWKQLNSAISNSQGKRKPVLDSGVEFEVIDFSACVKNYIQGKSWGSKYLSLRGTIVQTHEAMGLSLTF